MFVLDRVFSMCDLGVTFDSKLSFNSHTELLVGKAMKTLGFLRKITADLSDPLCLKTLDCGLVRSTLKYAKVGWQPTSNNMINRIEIVPEQFTSDAFKYFFSWIGCSHVSQVLTN